MFHVTKDAIRKKSTAQLTALFKQQTEAAAAIPAQSAKLRSLHSSTVMIAAELAQRRFDR